MPSTDGKPKVTDYNPAVDAPHHPACGHFHYGDKCPPNPAEHCGSRLCCLS